MVKMSKKERNPSLERKQSTHVEIETKFRDSSYIFCGDALIIDGKIETASARVGVCGNRRDLAQWFKSKARVKALLKFIRAVEKELVFPE